MWSLVEIRSNSNVKPFPLLKTTLITITLAPLTDFTSSRWRQHIARLYLTEIGPEEQLYLRAQVCFPNVDLEIIELLTPGNLLQKCKKPTLQPSHGFPSSRAHFVRKIKAIPNTSKYNILFSLHQPKKAKNYFDAEVIRIFTVFTCSKWRQHIARLYLTKIGPEEQLCLRAQDVVLSRNSEQFQCETFSPT